jgi:hypothetical protein
MKSEQLESLALQLLNRPVYVLLASDGVPFASQYIAGIHSRRLDVLARSFLTESRRWNGRQTAVYIDDREKTELETVAILCHELAHAAEHGSDATPVEHIAPVTLKRLQDKLQQTLEIKPSTGTIDPLHSQTFVRAACHLYFRAWSLGYRINDVDVYDGENYQIPSLYDALNCLGNEPERLKDIDVATVLILPAPERFNALFEG